MYFISPKYEAVDTFAKYIPDLRVEGIRSEVVVIRSDDIGDIRDLRVVLIFLQPQLAGMLCVDIFGDNEGVMAIANSLSSASSSKHIDVKFHFIEGLVRAGNIRISHVGMKDQHADILMQALWRKEFMMHRAVLINLIEFRFDTHVFF